METFNYTDELLCEETNFRAKRGSFEWIYLLDPTTTCMLIPDFINYATFEAYWLKAGILGRDN